MRIPVKRISLALLACTVSVFGQTGGGEPASSPAAQPSPAESTAKKPDEKPNAGESSAAMDYLFNRKPQDGTAAKQAMKANDQAQTKAIAEDAAGGRGTEDPQMRARFDRYLGTSEISPEELKGYQASAKQISELLRDKKTVDAWRQLYALAQYQAIDAGISAELANRIEAVWTTGQTSNKIDKNNVKLQQDIRAATHNADVMSTGIRQQDIEYMKQENQANRPKTSRQPANNSNNNGNGSNNNMSNPQGGGEGSGATAANSMGSLQGKLQLTEEYLKSLELKAKIKMNELKKEKLTDKAKQDFAEYISTLYNSGRFAHVVLAADFYRRIFDEGDYPVNMANQVNASLEINREVNEAVDVFRYKLERVELAAATDRLQEAFSISELHPAVLGLERPSKEKVAGFRQKIDQMKNLIEARDFANLEVLLAEIKKSATDFDTTKPMAIVNAVKLESQLRLGKAKLAAQQGDQKLAMEEFQAAAEAWPGNPDLQSNASSFFNTQDVKNQSVTDFDRLVKEQNYREIFDRQLAFAPAIHGDAKREEALKDALLKVKDAETAIEKANALMMGGDAFGAWESVELATKNLPDDKKLNKIRADLSGRSAEFVVAVNKARDAEGRNETGYSLTWYVNAQRQYPASRIANEGIDRLSKKLLQTSP